jgi:lipopolysaccharide transport system permease protein
LMLFYGAAFTWALIHLPLFAALALLASIGTGLWCAALNVRYRDVRFIIPFAIQAGLYMTPIGFSSQLVPDRWKPIFYMNPMVAVVDGFRWCINGGSSTLYWPGLVSSTLMSGVLLYIGLHYFRKTEKTFADVI